MGDYPILNVFAAAGCVQHRVAHVALNQRSGCHSVARIDLVTRGEAQSGSRSKVNRDVAHPNGSGNVKSVDVNGGTGRPALPSQDGHACRDRSHGCASLRQRDQRLYLIRATSMDS